MAICGTPSWNKASLTYSPWPCRKNSQSSSASNNIWSSIVLVLHLLNHGAEKISKYILLQILYIIYNYMYIYIYIYYHNMKSVSFSPAWWRFALRKIQWMVFRNPAPVFGYRNQILRVQLLIGHLCYLGWESPWSSVAQAERLEVMIEKSSGKCLVIMINSA